MTKVLPKVGQFWYITWRKYNLEKRKSLFEASV